LRKYEAVFILDPRKVEGNGEAFDTSIQDKLKGLGANITRVKCLDKKVFTYPIKKRKAGIYWDYVAEMTPDCVAKLEDFYRLNQTVLRLACFLYEDGQDDDVFNPSENREKLLHDEAFAEGFDHEDRPYGFRDDRN